VVVTYRKPEEFDALKTRVRAHGAALEGYRVDATDEAAVRNLVDGILRKHGHLDALVNTVGGYAGGIKLWNWIPKCSISCYRLNLRSGYTFARAVVPPMLKQRHGAIVNVVSKAALDHAAGAAAYAAPKRLRWP